MTGGRKEGKDKKKEKKEMRRWEGVVDCKRGGLKRNMSLIYFGTLLFHPLSYFSP